MGKGSDSLIEGVIANRVVVFYEFRTLLNVFWYYDICALVALKFARISDPRQSWLARIESD